MTQHFSHLSFFLKKSFLLITLIFCFQTYAFAEDVTLQWDANTESDLQGYKLYYGSFSGAPYDGDDIDQGDSPITIDISELSDPSNPEIKITGLDLSEYYYFSLTAYDSEGLESDYSNEVFIGPDGATTIEGGLTVAAGASEEGGGCFVKSAVKK